MTGITISKSVYLPTDPATVWGYLTGAEKLGRWFHPAKADLSDGADFTLVSAKDGDRMCWGRVTGMDAPTRMTWDFTVGPLGGHMTQVTWDLAPAPGGTRLTLTHTGLPDTADAYGLVLALDKGWHGFLGNLHDMT
ncbi:SRPBCC family protein [Pseudaestuariivita atlantica]|uniref:Activator of Hsp90 ATPase homologue 1/2-like C-terminal domain-containing protein n=1 Tax=Pseudaestuariivita atlantica TaxID=1317121 RepID=A0A0L1JU90_9RHOB|nr:SRPBCC domain-containing protein [Pseudaestuariivita atlantica]KNG95320.1 hypothetical protein ATO11_01450 [Pseudaestuariivita atlantica]